MTTTAPQTNFDTCPKGKRALVGMGRSARPSGPRAPHRPENHDGWVCGVCGVRLTIVDNR